MIFGGKITFSRGRAPFAPFTDNTRYGRMAAIVALGLGLPQVSYGDDRPEPMIFDLVDPLGAKKGEVEINTLLDFSPRTGQLEWSPEIEYSFADNYAVEFELPLENTFAKEYKVSLQGTFGKLDKGRMIHGWQA